jgi:flagellar biogenesis protein FliO
MTTGQPRMAIVLMLTALLTAAAPGQSDIAVSDARGTSTDSATDSPALDDPWSAVEPKPPERESRALRRESPRRTSPVADSGAEHAQYSLARTLGALAGVVGLIVLLAWGYRAVASGRLSVLHKLRRPGLIEVVSRTPLSARQSLYLVRIGPRLVLIGQSPDNVRTLDVIDDADLAAKLLGQAARARAGSSQAEFHECLEREARSYGLEDIELDERISPEALRIADVRQGLTDAIRRIRRAVAQV